MPNNERRLQLIKGCSLTRMPEQRTTRNIDETVVNEDGSYSWSHRVFSPSGEARRTTGLITSRPGAINDLMEDMPEIDPSEIVELMPLLKALRNLSKQKR